MKLVSDKTLEQISTYTITDIELQLNKGELDHPCMHGSLVMVFYTSLLVHSQAVCTLTTLQHQQY